MRIFLRISLRPESCQCPFLDFSCCSVLAKRSASSSPSAKPVVVLVVERIETQNGEPKPRSDATEYVDHVLRQTELLVKCDFD